ncbi:MAG TPA: YjbQ family protein [Deltaproteobacteria bacterium]|nr:YjbQ family protein [Deltaproteobacteria bacterium]
MVRTTFIELNSRGFTDIVDITESVRRAVIESELTEGLAAVFVPGSTASVTTIEYEEGVIEDLRQAIERLVPSDIPYRHDARWQDGNGFSHVRAALLKPGITVPFRDRTLLLGTWQQIVFIDFDNRPRKRRIIVQLVGE